MTAGSRNPCATCGICCRSYIVNVSGYDVWLLSSRQQLSHEKFLVAVPQQHPAVDGFFLQADGPTYGLVLDKQGKFGVKRPCVFLVTLGGDNARCGVYAERPIVCQTYPMSIKQLRVVQRTDALCPPDSWWPSDVAHPVWQGKLHELQMHFDIYAEVVARWNARVTVASAAQHFALADYLNYLINVYDGLHALESIFGPKSMEQLKAEWPNLPKLEEGSATMVIDGDEPAWYVYLTRARAVIDRFYPVLPPQRVLPVHAPAVTTPVTVQTGVR